MTEFDLDAELMAAIARVRVNQGREPTAGFQRLDLSPKAPQAGIGYVRFDEDGFYYEPDPNGVPALIVGVVQFGGLIDLAAVRHEQVATRIGIGTALGLDVIDRCRWEGRTLGLHASPWSWLHDPRGAFILDWKCAHHTLADIRVVRCQTAELADKVRRAFRMPPRLPRLEWPTGEARRG